MPGRVPPEALLDHAKDTIVLLEEEGTVEYVNAAVDRVLGYDPDRLVGENALSYVHPADVDAVEGAMKDVLNGDDVDRTSITYRFKAPDGSWVALDSELSSPASDDFDSCVLCTRIARTGTGIEDHSEIASQRIEELASATGDVLWMFNQDFSELLFVNNAYESVYGQPVATLNADPRAFLETIHPDDVDVVVDAMTRLQKGDSVDVEYRVNEGRDYGVWVWVQAQPIFVDGDVDRITGFTRDVTDRRRRERQLSVMDTLLRHNLRNDLTLMLGNADRIEERFPEATDLTDVIRETGESLLASADKERQIIDILTNDVNPGVLELAPLVERAVENARERSPDANVTLDVDVEDSVAVRTIDELVVAITELVENAVQHSESATPTVDVTVTGSGDNVVVSVVDDAPTMPEIEADVLTGNYEMNEVYHSSGLGLWLVHWVIDLSDGTIDVTSHADRGNEISITFSHLS
jgi:PAS domain S-box-containing protein